VDVQIDPGSCRCRIAEDESPLQAAPGGTSQKAAPVMPIVTLK
jgi:hypothetical protein